MENETFPKTLLEAVRYFSDPDVALRFMVVIRWPDGIFCPRCESAEYSFLTTRRVWKCLSCKKQFTVKLGTIMEDSPIGLDKWLCAIWMICGAKNGIRQNIATCFKNARSVLQPKGSLLIVESTYGVQSLESREDKEHRFTSLVHQIIKRGGHVLLPVFAIGRAQELLLILDDYWKHHPDLHSVPVYYASSLAKKCMAVYQTYIHTMNTGIRARFARRDNPFVFK